MSHHGELRKNAHAVIIGIDKYQDAKISDLGLARADADAEGVYEILTDPTLGRIPKENVELLLDEQATQRRIKSAIGTRIPRRAGKDDMVYIYFAGHGSPVIDPRSRSRDGMEKYLVPCDAELGDLFATGIAMDEIQRFFHRIESSQVLFFIDSCYSGEAGGRTFQNPHYQTRDTLTDEFLDDLAGEGRLVVTACDVNEVSMELAELGHGLFTYHLIEGLKGAADRDNDGLVTIHELYEHVYDKVSRHARRLGGSMHPIQKGSIRGKLFLTRYETAAQKQVKQLHEQAQVHHNAREFDQALGLWRKVIELLPEHAAAQRGLADIENHRKLQRKKRRDDLERKQRVLLHLRRERKLPADEFNLAMSLIGKDEQTFSEVESEIREFLDDLITRKISVSTYLKTIRLLRKPEIPAKKEFVAKPKPVAAEKKRDRPTMSSHSKPVRQKPKTKTQPSFSRVEQPVGTPRKEVNDKPIPPKVKALIHLRQQPLEDFGDDAVKSMLEKNGFFDKYKNKKGQGIQHQYEKIERDGQRLVIDHATGLTWQQSGLSNQMNYKDAENQILNLNSQRLAGCADWRLPTLEEAMSSMQPTKNEQGLFFKKGLYIDPVFHKKQRWIWTSDKESASSGAWDVNFLLGYCNWLDRNDGNLYVRAVRSGQSAL